MSCKAPLTIIFSPFCSLLMPSDFCSKYREIACKSWIVLIKIHCESVRSNSDFYCVSVQLVLSGKIRLAFLDIIRRSVRLLKSNGHSLQRIRRVIESHVIMDMILHVAVVFAVRDESFDTKSLDLFRKTSNKSYESTTLNL